MSDNKCMYVVMEQPADADNWPVGVCNTPEEANKLVESPVKEHLRGADARSRWFRCWDNRKTAAPDSSFEYDYIMDEMVLCETGADPDDNPTCRWSVITTPVYPCKAN